MLAIFLFYNKTNYKQSWFTFSKEIKHVSVITYDGEIMLAHELSKRGISFKLLNKVLIVDLIEKLKRIKTLTHIVCVNRLREANYIWWPIWIKSCNGIAAQIGGVEVGFNFNPWHLHQKLLAYDKLTNFEILYAWRRDTKCNQTMKMMTYAPKKPNCNKKQINKPPK